MGTGARDKVAVLPDAVLLPHQSRTLPSHQAMTWLLPFPPFYQLELGEPEVPAQPHPWLGATSSV